MLSCAFRIDLTQLVADAVLRNRSRAEPSRITQKAFCPRLESKRRKLDYGTVDDPEPLLELEPRFHIGRWPMEKPGGCEEWQNPNPCAEAYPNLSGERALKPKSKGG